MDQFNMKYIFLGTFYYLVKSLAAAPSCGAVQHSVQGSKERGIWGSWRALPDTTAVHCCGGISGGKLAVNYLFEYTFHPAVKNR